MIFLRYIQLCLQKNNIHRYALFFAVSIVLAAGCKKEQEPVDLRMGGQPAQTTSTIDPKLRPQTVNLKDPARMIVARPTGVQDKRRLHDEYEIELRDADGRNCQILAKRMFSRFTDWDLVYMGERDAIVYVGKPNTDSSEGLWLYNYKNNTDTLFVAAEVGMGRVTIAKDRNRIFYITGGQWHVYDMVTKKEKLYYSPKSGSVNYGSIINPEGTLVGGGTDSAIFIENVATAKRYEWKMTDSITEMGMVAFSQNMKYIYFTIYDNTNKKVIKYNAYFSPISVGEKLSQKQMPNLPRETCEPTRKLSNDGKYFYYHYYEVSYRVDIETGEKKVIPFLGLRSSFHLIEDK